jgi:hypothetical protein
MAAGREGVRFELLNSFPLSGGAGIGVEALKLCTPPPAAPPGCRAIEAAAT